MSKLEQLSVVALLQDLPDHGLIRGQVGTVVEVLSPSVALVDFSDLEGQTYAIEALNSDLLIRLHNRPLRQVA
jgi:Domain of unknown function (DUF4926)